MDELPDEIIVFTLTFLASCGVKEIVNVGRVSKRFHGLIYNPQIWRGLMKKDFPNSWCPMDDILEEYKRLRIEQKRVEEFKKIIGRSNKFKFKINIFNNYMITGNRGIELGPYN